MEEVKSKICKKCGEDKELDQYYNNKKAKDGKQGMCIACERIRLAAYTKKKKEAIEPPVLN